MIGNHRNGASEKLISRHCLEKTRTRWNDFQFLITDDRDFRPQTCTNGLVFRECKQIKNIFEDVYFTKNSFHITLKADIYVYIWFSALTLITMFGSSLPPVVCRRARVLFTLFVFVYI